MNGCECVYESIRIFEQQLAERIHQVKTENPQTDGTSLISSAARLAAKSGYSPWHFSRLFASVTGMTPKSYITGRILSECAAAAVQADVSAGSGQHGTLAALALAAGFADYETFSRSFKRRFGIAPRTLKSRKTLDSVAAYMTLPFKAPAPDEYGQARHRNPLYGKLIKDLHAETVSRPPFHITGLSFFLDEKLTSFGRLWQAFNAKQHRISARVTPERFCQYTAWTPGQESCREDDSILVVCALETDAAQLQEPVFVNRTVSGGTFLHIVHSGSMETIGETYAAVYRNIIAAYEKPLASCWEYQTYRDDGTTDIYIPLE